MESIINLDWSEWWMHLVLAPIYLIMGTLRHEGAHALVAKAYGATIVSFDVFPHMFNGKFYFGRVSYQMVVTKDQRKMILAAPYILNSVLIVACVVLLATVEFTDLHAFAVTIIGLGVSPLVDTLYNVFKALFRGTGDIAELRK